MGFFFLVTSSEKTMSTAKTMMTMVMDFAKLAAMFCPLHFLFGGLDRCSLFIQNAMEDDEFVSFVQGVEKRSRGVELGRVSGGDDAELIVAKQQPKAKAGPKPLVGSVPKIVWLVVGCLIVFGLIFWLYYSRRKQTTAKKKEDMVGAMAKNLKELSDEIQIISQKQNNMGIHLRNIANHSKSVEQGLSQALGDWTKTFDDLREEIGGRAAEGHGHGEAHEYADQGEEEEEEEEDEEELREAEEDFEES